MRLSLLAVSVILTLFACSRGEYWQNIGPAGPIYGVAEIDHPEVPCAMQVLGCYTMGYVYLQKGLEPSLRLCVLRHEYRHAMGDQHPRFAVESGYGVDCGDGTIMPGVVG